MGGRWLGILLLHLVPAISLGESADPLGLLRNAGLVPVDAELRAIDGGFRFTEGPTPLADGSVAFTDQPTNRILLWEPDSGVRDLHHPAGRANGLAAGPQDRLIACAEETNALVEITADGTTRVIAGGFHGKPFNGPNDVWRHPDGSYYLTDPFYPRPWARDRVPPQPVRGVYRVTPDGMVRAVVTDLTQPNGIVGTADGRTLFVSDIGAGKTYRYSILSDGSLSPAELLAGKGSDGMTLDEKGNIYLTGKPGVTVLDPQGQVIGIIPVPEPWTANVTFAGPDGKTLFITASTKVYLLPMSVRGQGQPGKKSGTTDFAD